MAVLFFGVLPLHAQSTETVRAAADSSGEKIADLPPAVLPVISSVLGRDDARYGMQKTADGYSAQNDANHLAAHYAAKRVEIRSQNASLGFEFQGWGYGEHPANAKKGGVAPRANANRVEYPRGALTEWYVNGPSGIEQGFTISRPPDALPDLDHDALDLALRLHGNLSASVEPGRHALTLRDQSGVKTLRYGPLLVYDASGRELQSWMEVQDRSVRLRVNTAGAHYPIVVDPWVQAAELTDGVVGDALGRSVAVDETGNIIVLGAPFATVNGNVQQGAAYVFVKPANGWADAGTYSAELINTSGAAGDNFGASVGISGNTIVVGAPCPQPGCMGPGAAYVFVASTWTGPVNYSAEVTASAGVAGDLFGYSVAISGNTIVVGAPQASNHLGDAYVFVKSTWTGMLTSNVELPASNGVQYDEFGSSVGINEIANTIVVGAPGVSTPPPSNTYAGAAYVFVEPASGSWTTPTGSPTFNAELSASDGVGGDTLGHSVGISGNTVVAGAPNAKIGSVVAQGAAYVFVKPEAGWSSSETEDAKLTVSVGAGSTSLGVSVGISGNTVVAGASGVSIGANSATGAAYVFVEPTVNGIATWKSENETAELTASVGVSEAFLGYAAAISGNTVVAGAEGSFIGANLTPGAAYVFTQSGAGSSDVISVFSGSGQTAPLNTAFSDPLVAQVVDSNGAGVSGVNVTFTAPPESGASGTFAGGVNTAVTDTNGNATSAVFTANGTAGPYEVTATAPNVTGSASFSLTNQAALIGTTTTIASAISVPYQGIATAKIPAPDALVGNPVAVDFKLVPQTGTGTPTGTVTVTDGSGDSCSGSVSAGNCLLTFAQAGTFSLKATYVPDAASSAFFTGSSSTYETQEIVLQVTQCGGFTTTVVNPESFDISTDACAATDVNGNPTATVLNCMGNSDCTIKITQNPPGSGVYQVDLLVVINTKTSAPRLNPGPDVRLGPHTPLWLGSVLVILMMLKLARRRGGVQSRRLWAAASLLSVMMLLGALAACSSGPKTPPGSYTVNVQFTDGKFNVVLPFPVVVK